jgi:putative membrane protein
MLITGLILAALAGAIHVYIFVLESVRWTQPATRRIFGVRSAEDAETMRSLAYNQGFYNLFLAVAALLGVVLVIAGLTTVGVTLVLAGTGMMLAAALVLVLSDRTKLRPAAVQGILPLLAVVAVSVGIA